MCRSGQICLPGRKNVNWGSLTRAVSYRDDRVSRDYRSAGSQLQGGFSPKSCHAITRCYISFDLCGDRPPPFASDGVSLELDHPRLSEPRDLWPTGIWMGVLLTETAVVRLRHRPGNRNRRSKEGNWSGSRGQRRIIYWNRSIQFGRDNSMDFVCRGQFSWQRIMASPDFLRESNLFHEITYRLAIKWKLCYFRRPHCIVYDVHFRFSQACPHGGGGRGGFIT